MFVFGVACTNLSVSSTFLSQHTYSTTGRAEHKRIDGDPEADDAVEVWWNRPLSGLPNQSSDDGEMPSKGEDIGDRFGDILGDEPGIWIGSEGFGSRVGVILVDGGAIGLRLIVDLGLWKGRLREPSESPRLHCSAADEVVAPRFKSWSRFSSCSRRFTSYCIRSSN